MKCPYCGYHHGWNGESNKDIEGLNGGFFTLSNDVEMERNEGWKYKNETRRMMGCPNCNKLFMDPR